MLRNCGMLISTVFLGLVTGCGTSGGTGQGPATPEQREEIRVGTSIDPRTVASDTPSAAVSTFLQAVRTGNDGVAAALLSTVARKKTAEMEMVVAPPGSDTAQFEVGNVQMLADGLAHVACKWSDLDHNAQRNTDEIVWVVKQEPQGWRIAGVAAPVVLDFENPQKALRSQVTGPDAGPRQQDVPKDTPQAQPALAQDVSQAAEQVPIQAQRPENPEGGIRR